MLAHSQPMRGHRDVHQSCTDWCWAALFFAVVLLQAHFARVTLSHGRWFAGWPAVIEAGSKDVFNIEPGIIAEALRASYVATAVCAAAGMLSVVMFALLPVQMIVYGVTVCIPVLLAASGSMILLGKRTSIPVASSFSESWALGSMLFCSGMVGLVGTCFSWRYIRLGVAVMHCTSAFVRDVPWLGVVPICIAVAHLANAVLWVLATLGVSEALEAVKQTGWSFHLAVAMGPLLCFVFFMWINACITALSSFTVAFVAVGWYRCRSTHLEASGCGLCPVCHAVHVGLRYHVGSFALGAVWLACTTLLKILHLCVRRLRSPACGNSLAYTPWQPVPPSVQQPQPGDPCLPSAPQASELGRSSVINFQPPSAPEILEADASWGASRKAFVHIAIGGNSFDQASENALRLSLGVPAGFVAAEQVSIMFYSVGELLLFLLTVLIMAVVGFHGFKQLMPAMIVTWFLVESMLHPYSISSLTLLQCCGAMQVEDGFWEPLPARALRKSLARWHDQDQSRKHSFTQHYAI